MPPIHIPLCFEAAILSRMRSPMTSRPNCAKDSRMLRVRRPIDVVVLNCCVIETKDALLTSRISTILAKIGERAGEPIDFVDNDRIDPTRRDVGEQLAEPADPSSRLRTRRRHNLHGDKPSLRAAGWR